MNIFYAGLFSYPDSSANSIRVGGVVSLLKDLGHKVTVLPGIPNASGYRRKDIEEMYEYQNGLFSGIDAVRGIFVGDNTINYLKGLNKKPDLIILYGTHFSYLVRLLRYCKKNKIKLLLDVVEWYDPRHLPGGLLGPFALMNEISMRFLVKRADGLFVISDFLNKYYQKKNCKTFLLPPLFSETKEVTFKKYANNRVDFCYVGNPGKKENFAILCESLETYYLNGVPFYMHFVGFHKEELLKQNNSFNYKFIKDDKFCRFYGKVSNDVARDIIQKSHFSVFFRPVLRFSNAGFPSKLAESLSLGTPVLCNDFSDVSSYIKTGSNGILINNLNIKSAAQAFDKAFNICSCSYSAMRASAYLTYKERFCSNSYYKEIDIFLMEFI